MGLGSPRKGETWVLESLVKISVAIWRRTEPTCNFC